MKNPLIKYICLALVGVSTLSSCEKNFLDVNKNPNSVTEATPNLIISSALNRTATLSNVTINQIGSIWAGYWGPSSDYLWYVNEKSYNITTSFGTAVWETNYDILNDFDAVEKSAAAGKLSYYEAMAKIMKAYHFQILVDAYGNIPYTEALQNTVIIRPKYDKGQDIYNDLIVQLTKAIELIKAAPATEAKPGAEDIFFAGNMTKWIKFANTLKLRILLRQTEVASQAAYIKSEIAKIQSEGTGFIGAGESVLSNPGYSSSANKMNPFYAAYYANAAGSIINDYRATRPTNFLLDNYKSNNDLRVEKIYLPVSGEYKGVVLGSPTNPLFNASVTSAFAPNGGVLKSLTTAAPILLSAESLFLQAEAAQRGFLTGVSAETLYNSGIVESFKYAGYATDAEATTYYGQALNNVNFAASSNKIEAIIFQKWLALNAVSGWEAWTEFRRTGFPKDNPISLSAVKTAFPKRLLYPNSELGANGDNVEAEGTLDPFTSAIFWDVN